MYDQFVATFAIVFIVLIGAVCFMYTVSRGNRLREDKSASSHRRPQQDTARRANLLYGSAFAMGPFPYGCGADVIVNVNYSRVYSSSPAVLVTFRHNSAPTVTYTSNDEFWVKYLHDHLDGVPEDTDKIRAVITQNRATLLYLATASDDMNMLRCAQHELVSTGPVSAEDLAKVMYPGYSHRKQL